MKKTICLCLLVAIASFTAGFMVCQNTTVKQQSNLIEAYDAYNKHTEELLDILNSQCNWVEDMNVKDGLLFNMMAPL